MISLYAFLFYKTLKSQYIINKLKHIHQNNKVRVFLERVARNFEIVTW